MKKKPGIIFLYPDFYTGQLHSNLGTSYIIAYLHQKGIYSEQFFSYQPIKITALSKQILDKNPNVIGFTCYDKNYFLIKLLSQHLKALNPNILIIMGGPTATFSDKVILKNIPEIDLCVRGEGEYTVYEILKQLKTNRDFSKILGITYRFNNELIRTKSRPLIKDENNRGAELDILPSPYLDGILDPYKLIRNNERINVITSRGCPYKCTFCNFSTMFSHTIRYHSVERVISELKIINKLTKFKKFFIVDFADDNFTFNNQRIEEICHNLINEKIHLNFRLLTRADYVNRKILRLLFRAGVREIYFALESAVPNVLYNIKKVRLTYCKKDSYILERKFVQRLKDSVKIAKEIGFKVYVSVIFGLPGERLKDGLSTLNFIKKLDVDRYYHNFLTVYAGTELFYSFKKNQPISSESRIANPCKFVEKNINLYNIAKLPIYEEKDGAFIPIKKHNSLKLNSSLMGLYKDEGKNNFIRDIILISDFLPLDWLIKNVSLQVRLVFGKNINQLLIKKGYKLKLNILPLSQILCMPIYKKNINLNKLGWKYKEIFANHYLCKNFSFFPEFLIEGLKRNQDIIFIIKNNSDIEKLERFFSNNTLSELINYTQGKFNFLLLDSCRWLNYCPAIQLKRIIINEDGDILPCFSGKVIGKVGEDLEKIKNRIISLWKAEKEKRGCFRCNIRDNCSQCLFLNNISYDRYCKIKRKVSFPFNKFINLIRAEREIRYFLNEYKNKVNL